MIGLTTVLSLIQVMNFSSEHLSFLGKKVGNIAHQVMVEKDVISRGAQRRNPRPRFQAASPSGRSMVKAEFFSEQNFYLMTISE